MTREEALNEIKSWDFLEGKEIEAIHTLIPELRKSEYERIREVIEVAIRVYGKTQGEWIGGYDMDTLVVHLREAFGALEKQKENPKSADSISSDCASDAKCEDRWHKVSDSLPDNGRLVLANDCLRNTLLARYDGEGNWEVSVYDNEDYYCRNTITKWCEIPSEKQKEQKPVDYDHEMWKNCEANFEGGKKEVMEHPEKYGLQKPADLSEMMVHKEPYIAPVPTPMVADEQKPDTRDADDLQLLGFIYDLLNEIEWKDNWAMSKDECLRRLNNYRPQKPVSISCGHENDVEWSDEDSDNLERVDNYLWMLDNYIGDDCATPQGKTDKIRGNIQEVLSPWLHELPERFNLQPKQEWSEEDKEKIVTISEIIEHCTTIPYSGGTLTLNKEYKKELLCFIRSLRPQPQGVYKQVVHSIFKMLKDKDFYEIQPSNRVSLLNDIRVKCKDAIEVAPILDAPSWKPSEEQMEALEAATVRYQSTGLESLYEDLKKLI